MSLQKFRTDIAPLYKIPEILFWFNEEILKTSVTVKDDSSGREVYYIPYDSDQDTTLLETSTVYYFEVNLEEIMVGYNTKIGENFFRVGYYDVVYQKPILLQNTSAATNKDLNIYMPKFTASGFVIEATPFLKFSTKGLNWQLNAGYCQATGKMKIQGIENSSIDGLDVDEYDIEFSKYFFKLDLDWSSRIILSLSTEVIKIDLKEGDLQETKMISLDAIYNVALLIQF